MININAIIYYVAKKLRIDLKQSSFENLTGGCIHYTYKITLNDNNYVIKINEYDKFPYFQAEAEGLKTIDETNCIRVPKVVETDAVNMAYDDGSGNEVRQYFSFLLMEYIEQGSVQPKTWKILAEQLACLHRNTHSHFGFNSHNFIGQLEQLNTPMEKWADFFREQRILPLAQRAYDKGLLSEKLIKKINNFTSKFEEIFPEEQPTLIHGDLWRGNLLVDVNSLPVLIDPAIYYGHREAEIAFTTMFGRFDQKFYDTYNEVFPLQPGFEERKDYYNVYHYLTHLLMFGKSYLSPLNIILRKF